MRKPSLVIVVLEDDHHKMLIYRHLIESGIRKHAIRIERSPSGRGSADNWARNQFVKETRVYRARHAQTALIIVIDADAGTVERRLVQLDQALREKGKEPVGDAERIARLVPRRNVETWILCLNGRPVNEETDYKEGRDSWTGLIATAATALVQWRQRQGEFPEHCVESLRVGIKS